MYFGILGVLCIINRYFEYRIREPFWLKPLWATQVRLPALRSRCVVAARVAMLVLLRGLFALMLVAIMGGARRFPGWCF
jgi:hypothetical protein